MLSDFVAAFDQAGNQQLLAVGVAEDDARPVCRRNHPEAVAPLLVRDWRCLPGLPGGLFRCFDTRAADREIGIVHGAATCGARMGLGAQAPPAASAGDAAQRKNWP